MAEPDRIPWQFIEPLAAADFETNGRFGALEALREEWKNYLHALPDKEALQVRQRSLRRLSIETGFLERLYDIEWGLTLTLVAEGFAREVVERAQGQLDDDVLGTLRSQRDALEMVMDFVEARRTLSPGFIRELHHAMTRTQATYEARDARGEIFQRELAHGEWKQDPNHVILSDGTILEYTPPEHIPAEMDRLVELYRALEAQAVHPVVKAAWLHHRFVQIHPFADGNGRVARALTLLVMQTHRYAPLVVDRWHRKAYVQALEEARRGSLKELVKLFTNLESAALASELERPVKVEAGEALEAAHTLAAQLVAARDRKRSDVAKRLEVRARAIAGRIEAWFLQKEKEMRAVFSKQGLADVKFRVFSELGESEKARWFRTQVISSAHRAGHYADLTAFAGYVQLRVAIENATLRYVASIHGAGRETGVMAVTTFGTLRSAAEAGTGQNVATTFDAFRFAHTESLEDLDGRAPEIEELLDSGLTVALLKLHKRI